MNRYDKYTDCPAVWNKSFPSHWNILPLFAIAKEKSICNCTDLPLLSVYLDAGVVPFSEKIEKRTNVTSTDLSKYQRVDFGDFVLNNQQAWRGSVGVAFDTGIVSPAYIVLSLNEYLQSRYANYLLRSRIMVDQYVINSKSVGSIQRNIYWTTLKRIRVPVPPREEQDQIVRFLDWKVSGINKLINIKRQQIAQLEELKKVIISSVITKGLNPNANMKGSGVRWIGRIPEHWDILPLYAVAKEKSICNCVDLPLLSVYLDVGVVPFSAKTEKRTNVTSKDLSKYQRVDVGDFVLNNQQAWRGSVGVSFCTGIVSPAYIVLSMNNKLNSRFANYLFRSRIMVDQYVIGSKSVGSIQRNIYWLALKRTKLPIPPYEEQKAIVTYFDKKFTLIDNTIDNTKQQIDELVALKTRLISDVVTGQIDVRGIEIPEYEFVEEEVGSDNEEDADDLEDVEEQEE